MTALATTAALASRRAPRFRLGATSYVQPGGWADNVERVRGLVSDVEILFFQAEHAHELPDKEECERLHRLRTRGGPTYSLHTPLAASLASADAARRAWSVQLVQKAIALSQAFSPDLFVLHVYWGEQERDPEPPLDLTAWRDRARRSLQTLLDAGLAAERLCIEVLDYDYALIEPVVAELGLSVALDVGHLERDGIDVAACLPRLLPRSRIVQWHGTDPQGRDHRSLRHYPRDRALRLLSALVERDYAGVLTLEVFSRAELEESLVLVRQWLAELGVDGAAAESVR